jgi:hypothetical protein
MTAYAAIGGALGGTRTSSSSAQHSPLFFLWRLTMLCVRATGGAVLLIVGVIGAYVVFKAVNAYKDYQINKGLRTGRVNFGGDDGL